MKDHNKIENLSIADLKAAYEFTLTELKKIEVKYPKDYISNKEYLEIEQINNNLWEALKERIRVLT